MSLLGPEKWKKPTVIVGGILTGLGAAGLGAKMMLGGGSEGVSPDPSLTPDNTPTASAEPFPSNTPSTSPIESPAPSETAQEGLPVFESFRSLPIDQRLPQCQPYVVDMPAIAAKVESSSGNPIEAYPGKIDENSSDQEWVAAWHYNTQVAAYVRHADGKVKFLSTNDSLDILNCGFLNGNSELATKAAADFNTAEGDGNTLLTPETVGVKENLLEMPVVDGPSQTYQLDGLTVRNFTATGEHSGLTYIFDLALVPNSTGGYSVVEVK
jgi:hypothetical protein